jgi:hypothetical protein
MKKDTDLGFTKEASGWRRDIETGASIDKNHGRKDINTI